MSDVTFKRLPGVLSFQRGLVISDALFYNEIDGEFMANPVPVIRHGIRGTQNINKSGDAATSAAAEAKRQEVSNIQTTDSAKLDPRADALIARFSLRFIDLEQTLFACAPGAQDTDQEIADLRASISHFVARAKESAGLVEVASRFARNIANARWLWRNRVIAHGLTVTVTGGAVTARFDALERPLHRFADYDSDEQAVAEVIAAGLRGEVTTPLDVVARVDFGGKGAVEVFPSQNYINPEDKPRGFARSLYCIGEPARLDRSAGLRVMGHAALRDQKVANALRTFDSWYPGFAETGRVIPIEPNGASLEAQRFFRNGKPDSAFSLMRRLNQLDPNAPEGLFMIACLIRGGVYSEGGK